MSVCGFRVMECYKEIGLSGSQSTCIGWGKESMIWGNREARAPHMVVLFAILCSTDQCWDGSCFTALLDTSDGTSEASSKQDWNKGIERSIT